MKTLLLFFCLLLTAWSATAQTHWEETDTLGAKWIAMDEAARQEARAEISWRKRHYDELHPPSCDTLMAAWVTYADDYGLVRYVEDVRVETRRKPREMPLRRLLGLSDVRRIIQIRYYSHVR